MEVQSFVTLSSEGNIFLFGVWELGWFQPSLISNPPPTVKVLNCSVLSNHLYHMAIIVVDKELYNNLQLALQYFVIFTLSKILYEIEPKLLS